MPSLPSVLQPSTASHLSLLILSGTQDTTATFGEHEELKTILRAGAGQFDIQSVCDVHTHHAKESADHAERTIHRITCNYTAQRDADLLAWQHIRRSAPVSSAAALRQLVAAARFACAPQTPRCPTLVLSSRADRLVNPVCSAQLAAAWQVPHQVHPWAGHDLPHDDGPWVCERVADWLTD